MLLLVSQAPAMLIVCAATLGVLLGKPQEKQDWVVFVSDVSNTVMTLLLLFVFASASSSSPLFLLPHLLPLHLLAQEHCRSSLLVLLITRCPQYSGYIIPARPRSPSFGQTAWRTALDGTRYSDPGWKGS